ERLPSLKSMDTDGRVILLFTLSKILSAGLRLAILIADEKLMDVFVRMKQESDLCTSKLTQHLAARFFLDFDMDAHLDLLRRRYRAKRDAMLAALDRYMPAEEGISWTRPEGGLFLWVRLPEWIDTEEMFPRALERKVAYVIGSAFYVDGSGRNEMRLCYSVVDEEKIYEGIKRLAAVVREELVRQRVSGPVG
ncbi:MAG TPA: PLP-dependent aminotransferase family protein, partial [Candidatus Acetothermia bacterium]|nr:PLP-dependent aminotransferase family protein [Candidatus Acetothermia bacterium]